MDRENKAQNKQLLHYGCLIYLTFKDDNGVEFLVTADGYTKNKILLKKKEDILKDSSISSCLFKIYPTFYNTEYGKAKKIQEQKKSNKKPTTIDMRSIDNFKIFIDAQQEIPKSIKAMEDETQLNYEQYDKYKSSPVVFGQTIQLLHINSNKYLNYDYNHVSEYESNNLKLSLVDEHSDETQYRIMACYTFQQEGSGNIYDQDIVNIVSTVDSTKKIGGEPYVHASKPNKKNERKEKREVNISTEKKTPWKINIFSEYLDERDGFLSVQDTVWINYSEQDLNLIALRENSQSPLNFYFEQCPTSANYTKFVGNSNGLFTIESESIYEGGLVKWDTPIITSKYRLRHLTTKKYLLVVPNPNPMEDVQDFVVTSIGDYQKASLFQFELMFSTLTTYNKEKAQLFLQKDSYFRASTMVNEKVVWLRTSTLSQQVENEDQKLQVIPSFNEIKKEEYVFKLAKANFNEVRMTNFLLSCLKTIKGAEQYLNVSFINDNMNDEKFQGKYKNFLNHMTRLERCLGDLQLFCHNKLKAYLYIDQEYGQINHFIQNVLREQQFIVMLVKLLCVSFPDTTTLILLTQIEQSQLQVDQSKKKKFDDSSKNRMQQIKQEYFTRKKKVCSSIYKLLDCICQQNQVNQHQASKFIPIFAQQSAVIDEGLKCIIQIIRDYEDLLLRIHEQVNDENETDREQTIVMQSKLQFAQENMSIEEYNEQYDIIAGKICQSNFNVRGRWDLLQFYTNLLKEKKTSTSKKRDIISFLQFSSTHRGKGLNVNQEGIYRCLFGQLDKEDVFRNEVLIKFEAQDRTIKVFVQGEEMIFVEFFQKGKGKKKQIEIQEDDEIGISKQLNNFLKKQVISTPSQQLSPKIILSLVSEQMEFYISMCNTRNNTWKRFVESFLPYDVLIFNLGQDVIGTDMRAIICKLLNKVYIDQEPRREIIFPELCKVVKTDDSKEYNMFDDDDNLLNQDLMQLNNIKKTVLEYISSKGNYVEELANKWDLKGGETKQKEILKEICNNYQITYNKLTLEVIRVFKLLINFGNYRIQISQEVKQIQELNKEFFDIIRQLFVILEFDPKYPESRKLLLEKRIEDAKKDNQMGQQLFKNAFSIFGDVIGAFNVFQLMDEKDSSKEKKKKQKSIAFETGPLNMNESFLKQADVLKKILLTYLQESSEADQHIKLEICDILNQYLDQKMDFCLNHFKMKFKEYVDKLQLIRKLEEGELNLESGRKQIQDQFQDVMKKCIEALIPQVLKTGTSADERLNPEKDNFNLGLGNLANLANMAAQLASDVEPQGPSKEIEAIDIYTILGFEIFPSIINLFCMTPSLDMQTKLLNILTRFYNQREEFAYLASQMLLLFDNQNIKIFANLKKKMRQLAKNIDESETWIKDPGEPNNLQTLEQTIEYFHFINQLLYADSYIEGESVKMVQNVKIDEFRQSIMRNLNVHQLCIQLITDCIGVTDQDLEPHLKHMIIDLFQNCYLLLKNFTLNNSTNQLLLSEHLSKLSLKMELDLGQIDLINEIFRNNKRICIEKPGTVIDQIRKLIKINGRQARFLEFFIIIQKVRKDYILSNQKAVLNMLLDPAYKSSIFWLKERQISLDNKNAQQSSIKHEFDFSYQPPEHRQHYKDEPYIYHASLIQVLFTCSIGKEGMLQNESRLRAIIPLKYALEILIVPDTMTDQDYTYQHPRYDKEKVTLMKSPLLNYIFYTYLESEKISEEIFKYIPDIQEYVSSEISRLDRIEKISEEFIEYFFSLFMLVMNGFFRLYQKEMIEQNLVHQNQAQVHQEIENLFQKVKILRVQIENNEYLKQIQLTPYQENLKVFFFSENIMEEEKLQKMQMEEEEKEKLKEQQLQIEEEKKQRQKEKTGFNLLKLKKEKVIKPENFKVDDAWKQLWQIFLETFLNSKELLDEIKKEQKLFAEAFEKVEEIYQKDPLIADHINKSEIFKKLIIFLSKGHSQRGCEQTIKQVLRALSNYIIISEDFKSPDLDKDKLQEKRQSIKEDKQNFLNSNNAMATILFILSDYKDSNSYDLLYNSILSFGIQMLEGGNREVQKSVYNFFINYTSSEVFFLKQHEKFELQKAELKKEDEDEDEMKYKFQDEPDLMENTLRFLQLLVEGHYTELQNYMRFQQMNYHTYDLFTDVVELQGDYLNAKKTKYFHCMIQCFDTITEYVQGPCFENQQALFQANFMDMAQTLLGVDERIEEIDLKMEEQKQKENFLEQNQVVKKKDIFPRWMYSRLKYKCSITLLSLLEGRKSNDVVFRLAKSLNLDMLKRNVIDIYDLFKTQYEDHYTEEIFGHFAQDPDPNNEQELEYSSFIVETGFNLYVLYSIFLEVRYTNENSSSQSGEQKEDFMEQLKSNIIGELVFLAINIIQGVNAFFLSVAKNINAAIRNDNGEIDYNQIKVQLEKSRSSLFRESIKFFASNSAHIEIQREDKMLEKIYFYVLPFCKSLDKPTKTEFNQSAKRISVKAKVTSLQMESAELIKKMKLTYQIQQVLNKIKVLALIVSKIQLYRDVTFIMALVINIMILFVFHKEPKQCDPSSDGNAKCVENYDYEIDRIKKDQELQGIIFTLGVIVIVLSMLIVLFFLAQTAPLIIKKAWQGWENDKLNLVKLVRRLLTTIVYLVTDFYVLYYISYGFTAFLGTLYNPFFFAFQLFDVLVRYPVLLNVVKAVWEPRQAILFSFFLFIVLMYVFSLIAYYWLYDSYKPHFCYSTLECLLTAIDRSFKSDGGLGGFLIPASDVHPNDDGYFFFRFFFDNIYFILLMIIMINIVSGIIIDTFGTLREELNNYQLDLLNICFICGHDKETIEKSSKNQLGFIYHIKQEHYMWNYLFYIAYLRDKDPTELSGIESYVSDKIKNEDTSWFPTFKALCLNEDQEEESGQVMNQLKLLQEEQDKVAEFLDNIKQQLEKFEEEQNQQVQ